MMKKNVMVRNVVLGLILAVLLATGAWANKSAVQVEVPSTAAVGQEITIELKVSHDGNSFMHFTDWVYVQINGQEVARWDFSRFNKPELENFSRKIQYKVTGPLDIRAEAHCNIHGSAGIAQKSVAPQ